MVLMMILIDHTWYDKCFEVQNKVSWQIVLCSCPSRCPQRAWDLDRIVVKLNKKQWDGNAIANHVFASWCVHVGLEEVSLLVAARMAGQKYTSVKFTQVPHVQKQCGATKRWVYNSLSGTIIALQLGEQLVKGCDGAHMLSLYRSALMSSAYGAMSFLTCARIPSSLRSKLTANWSASSFSALL